MSAAYRRVGVRCGGWTVDGVGLTVGFRARLVGVRHKDVDAVLLPVGSIHTWGTQIAIRAIAIDVSGIVIGTAIVTPRSVIRWKNARWILEVPEAIPPPPLGQSCTVLA